MSKPTNEQRRELVQTLLVVGGIVGGVIAGQPSYSSVLPPLILFVGITTAFYCMLFIEKTPRTYPVAALAIAGSFASLLFSIVQAVDKNATQADFTGVLSFAAISVALLVDWNKYNARGGIPAPPPPSGDGEVVNPPKYRIGPFQVDRVSLWPFIISVGLCVGGILFAVVGWVYFGGLALNAAKSGDLQSAEFALSIGFGFNFGGFTFVFAGLSEILAERRQKELRRLIWGLKGDRS
jgi:hypothetical protein